LLRRQARCRKANHDGVVSGQQQVDHDDLDQGRDSVTGDDIGHDESLRARSIGQPIWSVMFDPIQSSGPERSQEPDVIGKQRQASRKHPQPRDRQKRKNATNCQQ
jgi:hypothetical protein